MMELLRKAAKTMVAKILFVILIASFGIWGASHQMMTGASDKVITVGDQTVAANEFRLAYQRQVSQISQQLGTQLTTEQARAFGIDQQVYAQLVAGAALDQLSADMNLGLSKARLAKLIADDPAFKAVNGTFDRQLFSSRLRNAGLREDDYIVERSKVAVRSQIVDAVSQGFTAPKTLRDALEAHANETRTVDYLLLTNANIDPIKAPSDDVLAAWFEGVKDRYRAPEYRKFTYVTLEAANIADPASVSEDDVKADFERRKDSYRTPETRTIEQLSFPDREMADAAANQLAAGVSFDQLVTDQGKTAADVLLGDFTKDKMPDAAVADAAFAVTKDGGTTAVVDGSFGPVIIRVSNIKPETAKTYDEVKEEIRKDLALAAASQDLLTVHDRYEDLRASGSSLTEAASELKLTPVTVEAVDASGLDPAGNAVKDLPAGTQLVAEVFKAETGAETVPLTLGNDGYVWFEVTDVTAERDRPLAEVREKAVADWTAAQQQTALAARAKALADEVRAGKSLADLAATMGLAVETKAGIKRETDDPVLGRSAISAAFSGPVGTVASEYSADQTAQILLKVTEVNDQPTADALTPPVADNLARAAGDDILDQMVNQLQTEYGVSINRTLAEQAMVR